MAASPDQLAIIHELNNRRQSLQPGQVQVLDELNRRFNIAPQSQPQASTTPEVQPDHGGFFSEMMERLNPFTAAQGIAHVATTPTQAEQFLPFNPLGVVATRFANAQAESGMKDLGKAAHVAQEPGVGPKIQAAGYALASPIPGVSRAAELFGGINPETGDVPQSVSEFNQVGPPSLARGAGALTGLALPMLAPEIAGATIGKALPVAGRYASDVLGKTTGSGGEAVRTAFNNPTEGFKAAMRNRLSEEDILGNLKDAVSDFRDRRNQQYREQLAQMPQGMQIDLNPERIQFLKDLMDPHTGYGVKMVKNPKTGQPELDFSRSKIRNSPADIDRVNRLYTDLVNWGRTDPAELSPLGVDTLKQGINDLFDKDSKVRALMQKTYDGLNNKLGAQVPGYREMTSDYANASDFLNTINNELSLKNQNPGTSIRKLAYALNQNNGFRKTLLSTLDKEMGTDAIGQVAGSHLSPYFARGIMGPLAGAGATDLLTHLGTGNIPALMGALAGGAVTSPRLVGETAAALSMLRNSGIGKSIGAGVNLAPRIQATYRLLHPDDIPAPPSAVQPNPESQQ